MGAVVIYPPSRADLRFIKKCPAAQAHVVELLLGIFERWPSAN